MHSITFHSAVQNYALCADAYSQHNVNYTNPQSDDIADYVKADLTNKHPSKQPPEVNVPNKATTEPTYPPPLSFILENRSALAYDPKLASPSCTVGQEKQGQVSTGQPSSCRSSQRPSNIIPTSTSKKFRRASGLQSSTLASRVAMVTKQRKFRTKGRRGPLQKRRHSLYCFLPGGDWAPV